MSIQNKYVWAEFYPGFMDVSRPLHSHTQRADIPYWLYIPKLIGNSHYSGTTPYRLNEVAFKDHTSPLSRNLDYLDISQRPTSTIPHRRSTYGRLTNSVYY